MKGQDKLLYESADIWDQTLQPGQKNLAQAIIDFLPSNIATALDVGCGDGKLTDLIMASNGCSFIGLDCSEEALKRCRFKTVLNDATNLPFKEDEFDLVLTTDTLEHLSEQAEAKVWDELFRVAKNWVMVALPFREELLDATTKCHHCAMQYHVNWHQRSYDWRDLTKRVPSDFEVDKIVLTGEPWSPYHVIETTFRREILGEWSGWVDAFCPSCGQQGKEPDAITQMPSFTGAALGKMIYASLKSKCTPRMHSEVLVVYRRKALTQAQTENFHQVQSIPSESNQIIFADLQVDNNLIPYPQFARVVHSPDGGLILQFPAYAPYHSMQIKTEQAGVFTLSIEDGLGALAHVELNIKSNTLWTLDFPRETVPSYYGIIVRLQSKVALTSIQLGIGISVDILVPKPQVPASYKFFKLEDYPIYIQITKPCCFDEQSLFNPKSEEFKWTQLFNYIQQLYETQRQNHENNRFEIRVMNKVRKIFKVKKGSA
ncbi:MAG: methyltransferase domain-containing protein [Gammaproteobacteria bacterium]|jgi:SAM-dependent methyltransferase|nr:methyltransferase domain-containing protein [Gammaproteobacteria bacterium]